MEAFVRTIFGIAFSIFGPIGLYLSAAACYEAASSLSWPTVEAEIISSEVLFNPEHRIKYSPHVWYRYRVGKETYKGFAIRLQDQNGTKQFAEGVANAYAVGKIVQAHVNPSNPQRAVLQPGFTDLWFLGPLISAALTAVGLLILKFGHKLPKASQ